MPWVQIKRLSMSSIPLTTYLIWCFLLKVRRANSGEERTLVCMSAARVYETSEVVLSQFRPRIHQEQYYLHGLADDLPGLNLEPSAHKTGTLPLNHGTSQSCESTPLAHGRHQVEHLWDLLCEKKVLFPHHPLRGGTSSQSCNWSRAWGPLAPGTGLKGGAGLARGSTLVIEVTSGAKAANAVIRQRLTHTMNLPAE